MAFLPTSTGNARKRTKRRRALYSKRQHSSARARKPHPQVSWAPSALRTCLTDFMGWSIWIPKDRGANRRRFFAQKALVEKFFPCFRCRYSKRLQLECIGEVTPAVHCPSYKILVHYQYEGVPTV